MLFLLEEGRFHNAFEDKPAKCPHCQKNPSKYSPKTNSYNFARRFGQ
jgi:hypothetical protein